MHSGAALIAVLSLVVVAQAVDVSRILCDLGSVYSGQFNDFEQRKGEQEKLDGVVLRVVPVKIKAFSNPMVYSDESVNGKIVRMELDELSTDDKGNCLVRAFNFTDLNRPDPKNLDILALANIKPEDLRPHINGDMKYVEIGKRVFRGTRPEFEGGIEGKSPVYSITITCDAASMVVPRQAPELFSSSEYVLKKTGKYPAVNLPDGCQNICG